MRVHAQRDRRVPVPHTFVCWRVPWMFPWSVSFGPTTFSVFTFTSEADELHRYGFSMSAGRSTWPTGSSGTRDGRIGWSRHRRDRADDPSAVRPQQFHTSATHLRCGTRFRSRHRAAAIHWAESERKANREDTNEDVWEWILVEEKLKFHPSTLFEKGSYPVRNPVDAGPLTCPESQSPRSCMSWRCPACSTEIQLRPDEDAPRPGLLYRCSVCRLELTVNEQTNRLDVPPLRSESLTPPTRTRL